MSWRVLATVFGLAAIAVWGRLKGRGAEVHGDGAAAEWWFSVYWVALLGEVIAGAVVLAASA